MGFVRATCAALLFAATAAGVVIGAVHAMALAGTTRTAVGSSLMVRLAPQLEALKRASARGDARQIVFLGDSISISTTGRAEPVARLLRRALSSASDSRSEVISLAALGTGPFDYYFLADRIIAAGADEVVIALSLNAFGDSFRTLNRKQISGWLAPGRLIEAGRMPLHWIGLTYDELLANALIVQAGAFPAWHALAVEQARLGTARTDLAAWLARRVGQHGAQTFQLARFTHDRDRTRVPGRDRYTKDAELRHYGPVLVVLHADHPVLSMLAGTLRRFRAAGVSTLVYVNPINVDHLKEVGVVPSEPLTGSLSLIRTAVEDAGGVFLDLHALLPDAAFRDAAGHFGGEELNGPAAIAAAVAAEIAAGSRYSPETTLQ